MEPMATAAGGIAGSIAGSCPAMVLVAETGCALRQA